MSLGADKWLSGLIVLACAVMLLRLAVGPRRRARLDAWARGVPVRVRARWHALRHGRRARQDAERLAEGAIARARRNRVDKEGNVLRPDAFKDPRKPH